LAHGFMRTVSAGAVNIGYWKILKLATS
jgi:hypothetical protein